MILYTAKGQVNNLWHTGYLHASNGLCSFLEGTVVYYLLTTEMKLLRS